MAIRIVEVAPGEEVIILPNGNCHKARFIVYPKRGVLTAPGLQEVNLLELAHFEIALAKAKELIQDAQEKLIHGGR